MPTKRQRSTTAAQHVYAEFWHPTGSTVADGAALSAILAAVVVALVPPRRVGVIVAAGLAGIAALVVDVYLYRPALHPLSPSTSPGRR